MSTLEIVGSIAVWIVGTYVLCLFAAAFGAWLGRDKEMAGLIYVVYPPMVILVISAIAGLVMLGRISS